MNVKLWKKQKDEIEPTFKNKAKVWGVVVLLGLLATALKQGSAKESSDE